MRRRRKLHIIIPALLLAMVAFAILYLRAVEYTISAQQLLIGEIARATNCKAFCTSVRFELIKGLVLDRVVIYDDKRVILRAKEVSSGLLIPSLVSKRVIVPAITVESPSLYVELRPDGSLSLIDLFPKEFVSKSGMAVSVHKIIVRRGIVTFADRTSDPALVKKLSDFDLEVKLYLPVRAMFKASFLVPASTMVTASGEYVIPNASFSAEITSDNLSLKDLAYYYRATGITFPAGAVSLRSALRVKDGSAEADIKARAKGIVAVKDGVRADTDCDVSAKLIYDIVNRSADYSGTVYIKRMDIDGAMTKEAGKLENISATAVFDRAHLASDDARADAIGMTWNAKVNIANFANPIVDIYARAPVHLASLGETLRKRFGVKLPTDMSGKGDLKLSIQMEQDREAKMSGSISVSDATASLGSGNFPIEHVTGEFHFDQAGARWANLRCAYRQAEYRTSGKLADFVSPRVQLDVVSRDLSYKAGFSVKGNAVSVSGIEGKYLNSVFSAKGEINLEDPSTVDADLNGKFALDLSDLRRIYQNSGGVRKMKPSGKMNGEFEMSGDVKNIKNCYVSAKMRSGSVSAYGVKMTDVSLSYKQEQGVGTIKPLRSSLYGGTLTASARIDWVAKGMPYSINLDAIGVKMERLKADTGFSDKDVSGDIKVYADVKGIFKDASRLDGIGHMGIARGKLWQLNLFKGTGSLIFSKDFSDVVFTEGACDWKVADKTFFVDNLLLKSDILTLRGSGRIGFDRSVEGIIRPEIEEDAVSAGTLASAVGKGTVIEISGNLKEPRFRTKTNVIDVVGAMLQQQ